MQRLVRNLLADAEAGGEHAFGRTVAWRYEDVRAEIAWVHEEFLPVVADLHKRASDPNNMLSLTPAEGGR